MPAIAQADEGRDAASEVAAVRSAVLSNGLVGLFVI
jgi:hypothetical protein